MRPGLRDVPGRNQSEEGSHPDWGFRYGGLVYAYCLACTERAATRCAKLQIFTSDAKCDRGINVGNESRDRIFLRMWSLQEPFMDTLLFLHPSFVLLLEGPLKEVQVDIRDIQRCDKMHYVGNPMIVCIIVP